MKNKVIYIDKSELQNIKKKVNDNDNIFYVEVDGRECSCLKEYLAYISNKLDFPIAAKGYDGYADWMADLSWINSDNIVFVIENYKEFLHCDIEAKKIILDLFERSILPWWEGEVCNYVVGGETKEFLVYLVD